MARRWAVVSLHAGALHAVWRQALASPSRTRHSERGNEPLAQRDHAVIEVTNDLHEHQSSHPRAQPPGLSSDRSGSHLHRLHAALAAVQMHVRFPNARSVGTMAG